MPRPPAPPSSPARAALRGGLLAALTWLGLGWLGLPGVARLPFLPLLPVAAVVGAWLATTRARPLVDVAAGAYLALLLVTGFTPILRPGVGALVAGDSLPQGPSDAVVVLSARLSTDGLLSPAGADRLLHAVHLLHQGAAPAVVTTRLRRVSGADTVTSDADQSRLLALAPDSVRWHVVDSVATTRDEAVAVSALARREGWDTVTVVTTPLHTRRACAAFRATGLAVHCVAAPARDAALGTLRTAGDRWATVGPYLHEVVGWWWYGLRGWR